MGIDRRAQDVVHSAVAMIDSAIGAANFRPQIDLSGVNDTVSGAMNGLAEMESSRQYVFNVNGRELARATRNDYNRTLNGYNRSVGLGFGRG